MNRFLPPHLLAFAPFVLLSACQSTSAVDPAREPVLLVATRGDERVTSLDLRDLSVISRRWLRDFSSSAGSSVALNLGVVSRRSFPTAG